MFKNPKTILLTLALLLNLYLQAREQAKPMVAEQTGFMRSEAKIYVVMVVVLTILAGLLLYVARLDKKITKLEKGGSR
jgi:hypothetical protein